jgi:hypothetical protein
MTFPLPNDDIPTMIVPMILFRIKEHLEVAMQHEVPDTNPTKAILVKIGKFQDNPLDKNVSLSVSPGDYDDPSYLDGRIDHEDLDAITIRNLPVGEIGGGLYWWRRGTINFQTYFVRQRLDEEIAMQYAYDFYGRLLHAVEEVSLSGLVDDYGEIASGHPYIEGASFFESGGLRQFIWRGKLRWRVLTWRP